MGRVINSALPGAGGLIALNYTGLGSKYLVEKYDGSALYAFYIDSLNDLVFVKSTDGGISWTQPTVIIAATVDSFSVWYDRWSNISAGLIHIVVIDNGNDDTLYRTINTESSDALSTQTIVIAQASAVMPNGYTSITRAVGGNVYVKTLIDSAAEGGFYRLPNANVPNGAWDAARTIDEALAVSDQMWLLPDYDAADTQDIMAVFWDVSADELSRKLYDDSANSWSETSISTSMVEGASSTAYPHCAVASDVTNTKHWVIAWNGTDVANQDLKCWEVDSGAITAKTDVVTNATDDCGLAALAYDTVTGYLYAYWAGKTDGSETWSTAVNIYWSRSTDSGSTWSTPAKLNADGATLSIRSLYAIPRVYRSRGDGGPPPVQVVRALTNLNDSYVLVDATVPHANYQIGV